MRRLALLLALATVPPAQAQTAPHAWLFGSWTGGLFPVAGPPTAQSCLAHPTVIFSRDVVLRASLTDIAYDQRLIDTARTASGVTEFRFTPVAPPTGGLLAAPARTGFGCPDPNALRVQRRTDDEISFPGCADFPNPLVRCPSK